jgi:hypothetical protein
LVHEAGLGVLEPETFKKTVGVIPGGVAVFSIENYAALGGGVQLKAFVHRTIDAWNPITSIPNLTANLRLFKNPATAEVTTVENSYLGEVTYSSFQTSDTSFAARIRGTVETVNGAGAAGQQVTILAPEMYFVWDPTNYRYAASKTGGVGGLTFQTDVDGTFDVLVYSHKVATNRSIRIESGGKIATVSLDTVHNHKLVFAKGNNKLTWNFPKYPGLGTTATTLTFTDKWDNPVVGADLFLISGEGFAYLDGQAALARKTDSKGQISWRVRPFTTGRLQAPGGANAYVLAVPLRASLQSERAKVSEFVVPFEDQTLLLGPLTAFLLQVEPLEWQGFFGPQATASAGATKGQLTVSVFNAFNRVAKVYLGSKLVGEKRIKTRVFKFKLNNLKSGAAGVSVRIGGKQVLFKPLVIK